MSKENGWLLREVGTTIPKHPSSSYNTSNQPEPTLPEKIGEGIKQVGGILSSAAAHITGDMAYGFASNSDATNNAYDEFFKNVGLPTTNRELTRPLAWDVGDALHAVGNKIDENLLPMRKPEWSWDYVTDPAGLTSAAAQVLGSVGAILLPVPFAKRVGVTGLTRTLYGLPRGATKLPNISKGENIFDATQNIVSKINLPKIGSLEPYSKGITAGLFSVPMESLAEKGAYIQEALDKGVDYETARDNANEIYLKNLVLLLLKKVSNKVLTMRRGENQIR